jgi:hypothetical protein
VADKVGDVAARHQDGVDPGPLEREHLVTAGDVNVGDRQFPRGDVGQQLQYGVEGVELVLAVLHGEQEDLGVEAVERVLELLLVADVGDGLEALVWTVVGAERDRVGVDRRTSTDPEERQGGGPSDAVDRVRNGDRLRALLLRGSRAVGVMDVDDDRDPVAFRDALTEMS